MKKPLLFGLAGFLASASSAFGTLSNPDNKINASNTQQIQIGDTIYKVRELEDAVEISTCSFPQMKTYLFDDRKNGDLNRKAFYARIAAFQIFRIEGKIESEDQKVYDEILKLVPFGKKILDNNLNNIFRKYFKK